MQKETAASLVLVIANIAKLGFEAHVKLTALEKTLEAHQPNLYHAYLKNAETVKKNPPYQFDFSALATLEELLSRS